MACELGRWDLTELLPSEDEAVLTRRLDELRSAVAAFEGKRSLLSPGIDRKTLGAVLREYEDLARGMQVLSAYASLRFSEDTQSEAALTLRNRVRHILTGLGNRSLFFSLWWKALDDDTAGRLLPEGSGSADDRHFLSDLRRFAPYTLDEGREQLINLKNADGIDALLTIYSMITNRLEFRLDTGDGTRTFTRDALMKYVRSPEAGLREAAYAELHRVYKRESPVLAQIYANRVRDWHSEQVELRGFADPLAVRNLANDIPDEAVATLLETARANAGLFQRYFELKAGWLGMAKLRRYDLYAPVTAAERTVPYPEAVETVLGTFRNFHPRFAEMAERVFADDHIDSEIRPGKRGGAFCMTVLPEHTPWVLTNFAGEVRDVATLAHELGHAVHSMLAADHSILVQHPTLPLAETASVFGEMMVVDSLLERETDPAVRREILAGAVDDVYATVMRQAYFVLFEIEAHRAILEGRSPEELNTLYRDNLREQFGSSLEISDDFAWEWITIPHIYSTPFYCYAYSFGQLLVLSLYRRFRAEGDAFVPSYLRLLAHGGSARPAGILAEVDVDMTDPAFWQGGFDIVAGMIDELEALET